MENKIHEIRVKKKMTQVELAKRAGISRSIINEIENGKRDVIMSSTMKKISDVLEMPISKIFMP